MLIFFFPGKNKAKEKLSTNFIDLVFWVFCCWFGFFFPVNIGFNTFCLGFITCCMLLQRGSAVEVVSSSILGNDGEVLVAGLWKV